MKPSQPLLVSVHLPKTAGTSFAAALREHFGAGLREDYAMRPLNQPRGRREWQALCAGLRASVAVDACAVHGHFLPVKYWIARGRRPLEFATWLREPVDRVLSHFHYWKRTAAVATPAQPLRYRMVREDWSLERFCLGPEVRNIYRQYLWGFPARRFRFIGVTERYESDLERFARVFLKAPVTAVTMRANPDVDGDPYSIGPALRARIERHHSADVALYRWARERDA